VFYAIAIIITAYMPIFTLQRVEGRLFRPMAWTVAFALLGAMTFSILVAPVLASASSAKGSRMAQPGDGFPDRARIGPICAGRPASLDHGRRRHRLSSAVSAYLAFSGVIGSEFLPHLDEGAIWARGTLAKARASRKARAS
jgi:cobalt-zinc-cadmium resistance protein CzcA